MKMTPLDDVTSIWIGFGIWAVAFTIFTLYLVNDDD